MSSEQLEYYKAAEPSEYAYADARPSALLFVAQGGIVWGMTLLVAALLALLHERDALTSSTIALIAGLHAVIGLTFVTTGVGLLRLRRWAGHGMIVACIAGLIVWAWAVLSLERITDASFERSGFSLEWVERIFNPAVVVCAAVAALHSLITFIVMFRMPARQALGEIDTTELSAPRVSEKRMREAIPPIIRMLGVVGLLVALIEASRMAAQLILGPRIMEMSLVGLIMMLAERREFEWLAVTGMCAHIVREIAIIALLVSSIGCLLLAPAARYGMLIYAILFLLASVVTWTLVGYLIFAQSSPFRGPDWREIVGIFLGFGGMLLAELVYPMIAWFVLSRKGVREAFGRKL